MVTVPLICSPDLKHLSSEFPPTTSISTLMCERRVKETNVLALRLIIESIAILVGHLWQCCQACCNVQGMNESNLVEEKWELALDMFNSIGNCAARSLVETDEICLLDVTPISAPDRQTSPCRNRLTCRNCTVCSTSKNPHPVVCAKTELTAATTEDISNRISWRPLLGY